MSKTLDTVMLEAVSELNDMAIQDQDIEIELLLGDGDPDVDIDLSDEEDLDEILGDDAEVQYGSNKSE